MKMFVPGDMVARPSAMMRTRERGRIWTNSSTLVLSLTAAGDTTAGQVRVMTHGWRERGSGVEQPSAWCTVPFFSVC